MNTNDLLLDKARFFEELALRALAMSTSQFARGQASGYRHSARMLRREANNDWRLA